MMTGAVHSIMEALVIGGTRNLGPPLVSSLLDGGFEVSVFHRGQTNAVLPSSVEHLYGDRSDPERLLNAIGSRRFDMVVDTALYTGEDAVAAARIFEGRVRRYIMLSTGQVYLVRPGLSRPYREEDYAGATIPMPEDAIGDWRYGIDKRAAEDALMLAHRERGFPATVLRLPMVNSERDHFHRIAGYLARLRDGGPILIPEGPHLTLRHVYGGDVVRGIVRLAATDVGVGEAYNLSQDEEVSIEDFLRLLATVAGTDLRIVSAPRKRLESERRFRTALRSATPGCPLRTIGAASGNSGSPIRRLRCTCHVWLLISVPRRRFHPGINSDRWNFSSHGNWSVNPLLR
jgi:nucleoside-diphosphate-sugar epimerase